MTGAIEQRIQFDPLRGIVEFDLSRLDFDSSAVVAQIFGRFEDALAASGADRWYFIVNVQGTRIAPEAMPAFARRVRALGSRHSLGTVRYACAPEIEQLLEDASRGGGFGFRHASDRSSAETALEILRQAPQPAADLARNHRFHDFFPRFAFDTHRRILDLDLSQLRLQNRRDVADLFDHMRARIYAMGHPGHWYFLINFKNFHAAPEAWVDFSRIGRTICADHAIAVLRYGAGPELLEDLASRALDENIPISIFETREEALASLARRMQDG